MSSPGRFNLLVKSRSSRSAGEYQPGPEVSSWLFSMRHLKFYDWGHESDTRSCSERRHCLTAGIPINGKPYEVKHQPITMMWNAKSHSNMRWLLAETRVYAIQRHRNRVDQSTMNPQIRDVLKGLEVDSIPERSTYMLLLLRQGFGARQLSRKWLGEQHSDVNRHHESWLDTSWTVPCCPSYSETWCHCWGVQEQRCCPLGHY